MKFEMVSLEPEGKERKRMKAPQPDASEVLEEPNESGGIMPTPFQPSRNKCCPPSNICFAARVMFYEM
uniref:Uncharacterized protein n=1 Tax=Amphimedon queenslandica TaxID=400682 RepID=A0A1X7T0F9_AMPQE